MTNRMNIAAVSLALLLLVGCGRQGGPPLISDIGTQRTTVDEPLLVPVSVIDDDPSSVLLSADADELDLLGPDGLAVSGSGAQRDLLITPLAGALGSTNVTLLATDESGSTASESFALTVEMPFRKGGSTIPPGNLSNSWFGHSVAAMDNELLVGAPSEDDASGAAYLHVTDGSGWTRTARLRANDPTPQSAFGWDVAFDGEHAAVGAIADPTKGTSAGAVYLFERDGASWRQMAKLTASDGSEFDFFGVSLDIDGNYLIVGAGGHSDLGAAYLFELVDGTWEQVQILTSATAAVGDEFGAAVAIDGTRALVGARSADGDASDTGAVYVFERVGTSWVAAGGITAPDALEGDSFGWSLALEGGRAVVGAPARDDAALSAGAVYVFDQEDGGWQHIAKLTASQAAQMDAFGHAVDLIGRYVAVGAPSVPTASVPVPGAAYVFMESGGTWKEVARLTPAGGSPNERFGQDLSITRSYVAVGAFQAEEQGLIMGEAQVFTR